MDKLIQNIKENEDIYEQDEFDSFETELNEIKQNTKIQNREEKYFKFEVYFYFTIEGKEYIFPIQSDLFNINTQYTYELIKNMIRKINEKNIIINFNNIDYNVSLKDLEDTEAQNNNSNDFYINNYELKPYKKKNFLPKLDFPSFSPKSLLKNIEDKKLSIIVKNPLNIMIRENFEIKEKYNKYQNDY